MAPFNLPAPQLPTRRRVAPLLLAAAASGRQSTAGANATRMCPTGFLEVARTVWFRRSIDLILRLDSTCTHTRARDDNTAQSSVHVQLLPADKPLVQRPVCLSTLRNHPPTQAGVARPATERHPLAIARDQHLWPRHHRQAQPQWLWPLARNADSGLRRPQIGPGDGLRIATTTATSTSPTHAVPAPRQARPVNLSPVRSPSWSVQGRALGPLRGTK